MSDPQDDDEDQNCSECARPLEYGLLYGGLCTSCFDVAWDELEAEKAIERAERDAESSRAAKAEGQ